MLLRIGYELVYDCVQPTPMIVVLSVHPGRAPDLLVADHLVTNPSVPAFAYHDAYGNSCTRLVAPTGEIRLSADGVIRDSGEPDAVVPTARQLPVEELPSRTLQFLLPSRYCEADLLAEVAWDRFGTTREGWPRVQAICDFVHERVSFGYGYARSTKTAWDTYNERTGVCRDFTHLGIALCRSMNIPARYCTGYLGEVGTELPPRPGDFSAWFEAYLDGQWYTFDPRNNVPRIGRVLIAHGLDAADVPLSHTFGPSVLKQFRVWTDEIDEAEADRLRLQ
ncbi:MAG: transglutaminase family protein [Dehalococcoidia bacterium]